MRIRTKRTSRTSATRAVGYLRVSTTEQHLGPAAQAAAIGRFTEAQGIELVAIFFDRGISGGAEVADRPGLLGALAFPADAIIAAKRDRLARDVAIAGDIDRLARKEHKQVLSADGANGDDDGDALKRDIDAVLSAHERRVIRRRTRDALAVKKARGEALGATAMGYQRTGADHCSTCQAHAAKTHSGRGVHLETNEVEALTVARAIGLSNAGLSIRKIAVALNAEGHTNRDGGPMTWQACYGWLRPMLAA